MEIFFESRIVGHVEISPNGPRFTYEPAWLTTRGAFPISITMPLSTAPVGPDIFLPWAANLLPEGGALRRIGELVRASPEDVMTPHLPLPGMAYGGDHL